MGINKRVINLLAVCILSSGFLSSQARGERVILYSDSAHQDLEELFFQYMDPEEEIDGFRKALKLTPKKEEALLSFIENKKVRRSILDKEAKSLFGLHSSREARLSFVSYDRQSAFGKKLTIFRKTNFILLSDILSRMEFLRYRDYLGERKWELRKEKARETLQNLDIELEATVQHDVLNIFAGLPSFLPRTDPESLVTGFSHSYLVDREIYRLRGEMEYLEARLEPYLSETEWMKLEKWYQNRVDGLLAGKGLDHLEEGHQITILLPHATKPIQLQQDGKKRLFLDCLENGVALIPLERINFLARGVLRSYTTEARGDASRLLTFLQGRDLLVDNYRIEMDYLREGLVYLSREVPWHEGDLVSSRQVLRLVAELNTQELEFYAFIRDGAEEQFSALEKFLYQIGFEVEGLKVSDEEPIPIYLPGLHVVPPAL